MERSDTRPLSAVRPHMSSGITKGLGPQAVAATPAATSLPHCASLHAGYGEAVLGATGRVASPADQAVLASHEPAEGIAPSLLELLECLLAGGLHVLPGRLVCTLDLLKKLACFVGIGAQLRNSALVVGARLGASLPEVRLISLDLRLPDLNLAFHLFRKVLLQSHDGPPACSAMLPFGRSAMAIRACFGRIS